MSETRFIHGTSGQEVQSADINNMSTNAARADDRVFAELLRFRPLTTSVARGILPFGVEGGGFNGGGGPGGNYDGTVQSTVLPNSSTGSVYVNPFRAFLGSRTATNAAISGGQPTPQLDAWRDIRSAIFCPNNGTALGQTVALAANASGQPRWDLIQAAFTPDSPAVQQNRYVKPASPAGATPTNPLLTVYDYQQIAITVVAGTPGASPLFPSPTADGAGTWYIPLAYVRVPNGFGGASTVAITDIADVAPVVGIYSGLRAMAANQCFSSGGTVLSAAAQGAWGSTGTRPTAFLPACLEGEVTRWILLDFLSASSANWSHQAGSVVDDSIDWSFRYTTTIACAGNGASAAFGSEGTTPTLANSVPADLNLGGTTSTQMAQTFTQNVLTGLGYWDNSVLSKITSPATIELRFDYVHGRITVNVTGTPLCKLVVKLTASAPFALR